VLFTVLYNPANQPKSVRLLQLIGIAVLNLLCVCPAFAGTQYGADAAQWQVQDNTPSGAAVLNTVDSSLGRTVVQTAGAGVQNAYMIGGLTATSGWYNTHQTSLSFSLQTDERFFISVRVHTQLGPRTLIYNQSNSSILLYPSGRTIHHGLGDTSRNGEWHTWVRDLSSDLSAAEPGNTIQSVNGLLVKGNVRIADIQLGSVTNTQQISFNTPTIYSDAENGDIDGWRIDDSSPAGAAVDNVTDPVTSANNAIDFTSSGKNNSFLIGSKLPNEGWNNTLQKHVSWRHRTSSSFGIYVRVETSVGNRFLVYDARNNNLLLNSTGVQIHHGLGSAVQNGEWHTISRDLQADLQAGEPDATLIAVHGVVVRGSMLIDDLMLLGEQAAPPPPVVQEMPTLGDYDLVFNDEFNGNSLDSNKWQTGLL